MSLNYQDSDAAILSVDAQYSLQQGVIVQVTGTLQTKVRPRPPAVGRQLWTVLSGRSGTDS